MIDTEAIYNYLNNKSNEELHFILQEIVNEYLVPVSPEKYYELIDNKRCLKSIYNAFDSGKLKGIKIDNKKFIYVNYNN